MPGRQKKLQTTKTKPSHLRGLCSYQGNFDRLSVGFGQLVQMAEVNRFDADFQQVDNIGRNAGQLFDLCQRQVRSVESSSGEAANRLRCSPVDERSSDSENRKAYRTNSGSITRTGNLRLLSSSGMFLLLSPPGVSRGLFLVIFGLCFYYCHVRACPGHPSICVTLSV